MCESWCCAFLVVGLFIIYKVLDRILRIPYIALYRDRYVLITGCGSGFGLETTKRLDSMGCHVFAGCRRQESVDELKKTCSDRVMPILMDVSDPDSVRKAFIYVTDRLARDGGDLWGIVNNAAITGSWGPPDWMHIEDYRKVADVNLYGTIDVTMTFLPLIKRSRGRIVNVSSAAGVIGFRVGIPYCVTKFGVEAFSDALRRSLRPYGCMVSVIEPGGFDTKMYSQHSVSSAIEYPWNHADHDIKEEYGEEYFQRLSNYLTTCYRPLSSSLKEVADAYQHALLGCYPRDRYRCGFDVKLLAPLIVLPEWFMDRVLEHLENSMTVLPAALRRKAL
jgi:retinol dehydrogenase-16